MYNELINILVSISCLINSLTCFIPTFFVKSRPSRYEMLSSRSYRCNWIFMMFVLDKIFGKNHCKDCFNWELDKFDGIQD